MSWLSCWGIALFRFFLFLFSNPCALVLLLVCLRSPVKADHPKVLARDSWNCAVAVSQVRFAAFGQLRSKCRSRSHWQDPAICAQNFHFFKHGQRKQNARGLHLYNWMFVIHHKESCVQDQGYVGNLLQEQKRMRKMQQRNLVLFKDFPQTSAKYSPFRFDLFGSQSSCQKRLKEPHDLLFTLYLIISRWIYQSDQVEIQA